MMKYLLLVFVSGVILITFNIIALNILSPGTLDCVNKYQEYERNIHLLEEELQTLRFELKSAWKAIGKEFRHHQGRVKGEIGNKSKGKTERGNETNENIIIDNYRTKSDINVPHIYMITPTYARWTQKADLTRLCQTLMHVDNLIWIVVEDSNNKTDLVKRFLQKCKVKSVHLNIRTPEALQLENEEPVWKKSRGVEQRNLALTWIRDNISIREKGIVYFGDDDNTYDLDLFNEIRRTDYVSVWPVGICGGLRWEGPVCENGHVKYWHTAWAKNRPFPTDFAGFAMNISLIIQHRTITIDPHSKIGWVESDFLIQFVNPSEVKTGPSNCMNVYVWHTRTEKPKMRAEEKLSNIGKPSNPLIET